jgi:hypothetical protein
MTIACFMEAPFWQCESLSWVRREDHHRWKNSIGRALEATDEAPSVSSLDIMTSGKIS